MNVAHVTISDVTVNRLRLGFAASSKNLVTTIIEEDISITYWTLLSEESFSRNWDNEDDAIYDNWREIYGVPTR